MPKVSDEHKAEQRERILRGTMEVFARKGVGATTMGDIIEVSGLSAGAIYGYYSGKDDLIRQAAEDVLMSRRADLERLAAGNPLLPPHELIHALLSGLLAELPEPAIVLQFWAQSHADAEVRAVAERATALDMTVIAFDPFAPEHLARRIAIVSDLDQVLAEADILSLHAIVTDETRRMINRETIARMKDGVLIINTARGALIHSDDLAEALRSGKVANAFPDDLN